MGTFAAFLSGWRRFFETGGLSRTHYDLMFMGLVRESLRWVFRAEKEKTGASG